MTSPETLGQARVKVLALAASKAKEYGWAAGLPTASIDEAAYAYLSAASTAPETLVELSNPFAVGEQLSEVSGLFERATQFRLDAHGLEAALLNEVLDDDLADEASGSQQLIDEMAYLASVEATSQDDAPAGDEQPAPVTEIYRILSEARSRRRLYRMQSGHPFNLLEQLEQARDRYFSLLSRLLAKAEAVQFVLEGSFGYSPGSVLDQVRATAGKNPLPIVELWLRNLAVGLEAHAARERVVTIYRLLGNEGWTDLNGLRAMLKSGADVSLRVELTKARLGVLPTETARLLAIGVAPVFGSAGISSSMVDATYRAAYLSDLRSTQEALSFDAAIEFESIEYAKGPRRYNYPGVTESFGGIAAWGTGSGPAARSIGLRGSSRLTNRPIDGCFANISLLSPTRSNSGTLSRDAIPKIGVEEELTPTDLAIAIRFAAVRKS